VAEFVAPRAARVRRPLRFVPHQDDTGRRQVEIARSRAVAAGLLPVYFEVEDVGDRCKDLNDALRQRGAG